MDKYVAKELLFSIASENYRVTVDKGVTCKFCEQAMPPSKYDYDGENHTPECIVSRSREALLYDWEMWTVEQEREREHREYLKECEEEKAQYEKERAEYLAAREHNRVNCDICNKRVHRDALDEHKATNVKCRQKATGIKCVSVGIRESFDYTGPRCLNCFDPMPDAHPNKKFCSNKGPGNCKDRYHNSSSDERRKRAKIFTDNDAPQDKLDEDPCILFRNQSVYQFTDPDGNVSHSTLDPDIDEDKGPLD